MENLKPLMTSGRTGESSRDQWRTPLWLYTKLDQEFNFNLDPAATDENALCENYFTEKENGLVQPWFGNVFLNPPYSQMKAWVAKAAMETDSLGTANLVVTLVAARTDTKAWWDYIRFGEVRFIQGRIKFDSPTGDAKFSAPFPSAVVIFRQGGNMTKTVYWKIKQPR